MMDKSNYFTAYISDSDAIIGIEDAYNKIVSLYLGEDEGQLEYLSNDIKEESSVIKFLTKTLKRELYRNFMIARLMISKH